MICPTCGANVPDGLRFCVECGSPVAPAGASAGSSAGSAAGASAGAPAGSAAGAPAGSAGGGQASVQRREPTVRRSSDKESDRASKQVDGSTHGKVKPDFGPQTAYRRETFEQGPGPAPDPADPLPVSSAPSGGGAGAGSGMGAGASSGVAGAGSVPGGAGAPPAPSGASGRPKRGCMLGGIVIVVLAVLLLFASCSIMSQCASIADQQWTPSSGTSGAAPGAGVGTGTGAGAGTSGNASAGGASQSGALTANPAVAGDDTWTVLFYLCGSDLESESGLATFNLQELTASKLGDKVTFAIETGGAKRWRNSSVSARYLTRYTVGSNGFYEQQKLPSASMAVSSTFEDFLRWGVQNYPADHYMLVMWDHGGGSVYGVCNDELFPGRRASTSFFDSIFNAGVSDTLTLTEMVDALKNVDVQFDVIGFDTCLMGTYETAVMLEPFADYLVASEEVEPGSGWDYTSWPQWLGAHTSANGAQLGAQICDTYYSKCRLYNAADMATLSVVDLSKIGAVSDSFYGASREIAQATNDRSALRALQKASQRVVSFGGDSSFNMVDMSDLMMKARSVVSEHYDDVIADVGQAVVYQVRGRSRSGANGLSVFYPLDTSYSSEFFDFLDVAGNVPYAQFAAVMFGQYNAVDWSAYAARASASSSSTKAPVQEEDIAIEYTTGIDAHGSLEMRVTSGVENIADIGVQLAMWLPDQGTMVYLGTDSNVNGSFQTGVFTDNFYGQWMAIDGNYVSATLLESGDDYNLYTIPVLLNGVDSNLIARYDFNSGSYEIVSACSVAEDGMASKNMRALEPGDELDFQFEGYLVETDEPIVLTMGHVTWRDGIAMADVDLGDGAYLFQFVLTDILGHEHATDLYVQNYQGNTITVETLSDFLSGQ